MNIEQIQSDELSMTLSLHIEMDDYIDQVRKSLLEFRRKAEVRGFRKGMVPMGLVQKMYGRTALLEEVNKLISQGLEKYLNDNNIKIIGEPLPNEERTQEIDWEHDETFTFFFDLILTPKVKVTLSADDHIPIKEAEILMEDKEAFVESLRKENGRLCDVDVAESEDFLRADLMQGDKSVIAASISLKSILEEELKQPFIGIKVGDTIEIDVVKTFPNPTDRAALLNLKKEELDDANPVWQVTILEVKRYVPAPLDQEFYDCLFGEGRVDSHDAFMKEIEEKMKRDFVSESNYRFAKDAREYIVNKCAIELPDHLLKRWLHLSNDGKLSMEDIERDYDAFVQDFRWQLIRGYLVKEKHISISKDEMMTYAIRIAQYRLYAHGYFEISRDDVEKIARNILADEKESGRITEMAQDDKVFALIQSSVTLDPVKVPFSELSYRK